MKLGTPIKEHLSADERDRVIPQLESDGYTAVFSIKEKGTPPDAQYSIYGIPEQPKPLVQAGAEYVF